MKNGYLGNGLCSSWVVWCLFSAFKQDGVADKSTLWPGYSIRRLKRVFERCVYRPNNRTCIESGPEVCHEVVCHTVGRCDPGGRAKEFQQNRRAGRSVAIVVVSRRVSALVTVGCRAEEWRISEQSSASVM